MLVQKLLRIDDTTIQEVEELAKKMSEKEYISFSALVRQLIRQGLNNMETKSFIENIKNVSGNVNGEKERVLTAVKKDIERMAKVGSSYCLFYPSSFRRLIASAIENCEWGDESKIDFDTHHEMLNYTLASLRKEGFKVSISFRTSEEGNCATGLYYLIEW